MLLTVHNRKEKTVNCLNTLRSQLPVENWETDVYMTDDGCTDGTAASAREAFPGIRIIQGDGNLYWAGGMRKAWAEAAKGDYDAYIWLNDDTELLPGAMEELLGTHLPHPDAILVGSTRGTDGSPRTTYGGTDENDDRIPPDGTLRTCDTFNGNIVLIPGSVYRRLGNIDPVYSHSLGDADYGMAAKRAGIERLIMPRHLGICDNNPQPPKWMRPGVPMREKIKNLFSPLGYMNPREYYHFKKKFYGRGRAALAICSVFLLLIAPGLWHKIRKR